MYKNVVYYDNKLYVKEVGSTKFKSVKYEPIFYAEKSPSASPDQEKGEFYYDCFGNKLKAYPIALLNNRLKYVFKENRLKEKYNLFGHTAEGDLRIPTKYIHDNYEDYKLSYDEYKDYRIAFYDIETQTGRPKPMSIEILIRNKQDPGQKVYTTVYTFEHEYDTTEWYVLDPETDEFTDWRSSSFILEEFPNPEEAKFPINLITVYSTVDNMTHTWGLEPYTGSHKDVTDYRFFDTESDMLWDFVKWMKRQSFDILTGWNSENFDDPYIINRITLLLGRDAVKNLSPIKASPQVRETADIKHYSIPGLFLIDYLALYKFIGFVKNSPSWKLDYIGKKEVGEGKVPLKWGLLEHYIKDYNTYVEYNVQDVRLMVKIEEKKQLWPTVITYANESMITLDQAFSMTAAHDGYIMKFLHSRGQVYPDLKDNESLKDWWREEGHWKVRKPDGSIEYQNCPPESNNTFEDHEVKAGFCYADPGRYQHCMSSDITSSYPNHLIMYNISPETVVKCPSQADIDSGEVIASELNDVGFKRTNDAILPSIASKIFDERLEFKHKMIEAEKNGDAVAADRYRTLQLSRKKLINSLYGACLYSKFRLFNLECARSITRCARVTIRYLKDATDSFYRSREILDESLRYFPVIFINGKWHKMKEEIETDQGILTAMDLAKGLSRDSSTYTIDGKSINFKFNNLRKHSTLTPKRKISEAIKVNIVAEGEVYTYDLKSMINLTDPQGKSVKFKIGRLDAIPLFTDASTGEELPIELDTLKGYLLEDNHKKIDFANLTFIPTNTVERESVVIQADTDSNYYCFEEHYHELFPYLDDMTWFYCMEEMMNAFWKRVLDAKAEKRSLKNRIIFTRENLFSHFLSYGKKMYFGSIVDKDGKRFGYTKDLRKHLKIQGLVLKKAEFPVFCLEHAVNITTDVLFGLNRKDTTNLIKNIYEKFQNAKPEEICANRTIGNLKPEVAKEIKVVGNEIIFPKGVQQSVKIAYNFNLVNQTERLALAPLSRGTKAKYLFLIPNNKYNMNIIGFETWPKEFDSLFKIDYIKCFDTFFLSTFGALFYALGWNTTKKLDPSLFIADARLKSIFG